MRKVFIVMKAHHDYDYSEITAIRAFLSRKKAETLAVSLGLEHQETVEKMEALAGALDMIAFLYRNAVKSNEFFEELEKMVKDLKSKEKEILAARKFDKTDSYEKNYDFYIEELELDEGL